MPNALCAQNEIFLSFNQFISDSESLLRRASRHATSAILEPPSLDPDGVLGPSPISPSPLRCPLSRPRRPSGPVTALPSGRTRHMGLFGRARNPTAIPLAAGRSLRLCAHFPRPTPTRESVRKREGLSAGPHFLRLFSCSVLLILKLHLHSPFASWYNQHFLFKE